MQFEHKGLLSDETLERFRERAAGYDRENTFFHEDFEELKAANYLLMNVPKELGGLGMTLSDVCREQRRLAYYAPATALATNMHLYWMGVANDLWRSGDKSCEWMLTEAVKGEVFAAGHAEGGNDLPLFLSTAKAERADGGYKFHGRKMFGSLAPVWTYLGLHAMDSDDERGPQIVHAFMPRKTEGYRIEETWDTLGMRATRSDDTVLDGCFVADEHIGNVVAAGQLDFFVLAIFGWAEPTFGNIYYGIALRCRDLVVPSLRKRTSLAMTRPMAYHPAVQHNIAEMTLELEAIGPQLDKVADDWSNGVDHGNDWPLKLVAAKYNAVEAAWRVVDRAMDLSGGTGMFKAFELERLFRDARAGRFHPANSALAHEIVGKTILGIDLGEQPRWG